MFGAFDPARGLSRPAFLTFMSLAALGTLLTAAYLLLVVRRVCMGTPPQTAPEARDAQEAREAPAAQEARETRGPQETPTTRETPGTPPPAAGAPPATPAAVAVQNIQDVQGYELATWSPLVALTVLAGLWPAALLGLTDPAVQKLLAGGKA